MRRAEAKRSGKDRAALGTTEARLAATGLGKKATYKAEKKAKQEEAAEVADEVEPAPSPSNTCTYSHTHNLLISFRIESRV